MNKQLFFRFLCWVCCAMPTLLTAQIPFNCNSFEWVNPLPTSNTYYGIDLQGADTIWVGGDRQTLVRSVDGGSNWEKLEVNFGNRSVRDVEFVDHDTGFVATALGIQGRVYRTTDGGTSWDELNLGFSGGATDIQFLNHDTGFVATGGGVLRTLDCGLTWTNLGSGSSGSKVHFVDLDTGMVISGVYDIERTTNGGQTWTTTTLPNGTLQDFAFIDADTGFVFGGIGYWFKTTDAGASWNSHPNPGIFGIPYLMAFQDSIGYASSVSGFTTYFYKSTDYGNSFTSIYSLPQHNIMYGIEFRSPDDGILVGRYGSMFITDDGGTTVNRMPGGPLTFDYLYELDFPTPDSGFATGRGQILFTSDGGQTWAGQPAPQSTNYYVIDFYDSQKGIVMGYQGAAARTTNGGQTWLQMNVSGTHNDCQYVNDSVVHAIGSYNGLRVSTNNGLSWSYRAYGTSGVSYYDLSFVDGMKGMVVGTNGNIGMTTDGGLNWTYPNTPTNLDLYEAYWQDSLIGHVGGESGLYLRTTDGGLTWSQTFIGAGIDIEEFSFVDSLNGFVLMSDFGDQIYQTTDGGLNWSRVFLDNSSSTISSIHFFNPTQGIGTGFNGTILRYQLGLTQPTVAGDSICGPGDVLLQANGGNGFAWYSDSALTNPVGTGAQLPVAVTQTDTFYVQSVYTALNCQSEVVPVTATVLVKPALAALPADTLCTPDSLDLTTAVVDNQATGAALNFWVDSLLSVPIGSTVGQAGTYFASAMTPDGCADSIALQAFIFPSPQLMALPADTLCTPDSLDLTTAVVDNQMTGALLNFWADSLLTIPIGTTVGQAGTYFASATTSDGCADSIALQALIFPSPALSVISPDTVCAPNTVDLTLAVTDSAQTSGTLAWFSDAALSQVLAQPSAVDSSGWYYVLKTTAEGCEDFDSVEVVVEICVGLDPAQVTSWKAWPNPAAAQLYVGNEEALLEDARWQLYGMDGRLLRSGELKAGVGPWEIDLEGLANGTYSLVLDLEIGRHWVRIQKQ